MTLRNTDSEERSSTIIINMRNSHMRIIMLITLDNLALKKNLWKKLFLQLEKKKSNILFLKLKNSSQNR
jgi:hypothetical protein